MTSTEITSTRGDAFAAAVAKKRLSTDGASRDGLARVAGLVLMVVGVVGAFVAWNTSMSQGDSRAIASSQILAIAFVGVTVSGTGLYAVGALARVLRLWLLRQLVESQDRADQLHDALEDVRRRDPS